MLKEKQFDKLLEAEDILTALYFEINEQKGSRKEADRLDVILGKLYNLKHSITVKG